MKLSHLHKNSEGFTLVELMIVVAIIGILAAVAIPQFAAYRMRGFNTSAVSDVKNLATSEAAYYTDNMNFGVTNTGAVLAAIGTAGGVLLGPAATATHFIHQFVNAADRQLAIPLGNGVRVAANVDATAQSFTGTTKHDNGNNYYGVDSDVTATFSATGIGNTNAGVALIQSATTVPASVVNTDQYTGAALTPALPAGATNAWAAM